ncbi:hypothetical protein Taro_005569 [Colocasia esculenta]|uniref:Uncharacterized protein n=1 Tax=Colocasia esculenta TaxID=4460 RepID=A0A843TL98_COLES|nr:hypothetical protein [Colocasia esculenta]
MTTVNALLNPSPSNSEHIDKKVLQQAVSKKTQTEGKKRFTFTHSQHLEPVAGILGSAHQLEHLPSFQVASRHKKKVVRVKGKKMKKKKMGNGSESSNGHLSTDLFKTDFLFTLPPSRLVLLPQPWANRHSTLLPALEEPAHHRTGSFLPRSPSRCRMGAHSTQLPSEARSPLPPPPPKRPVPLPLTGPASLPHPFRASPSQQLPHNPPS